MGRCHYRDTFETSKRMSTYQIALAICKFPNISISKGRVFIPPPYIRNAQHIINSTNLIIKTIEKYFRVALPSEKLDIIVARDLFEQSSDYRGLVLLSEEEVLYEKMNNPIRERQNILTTIIRKLIQQWFGSVISSARIEHWINDGFSTLLEYTIGNLVRISCWKTFQRINHLYLVD